MPMMKNDKSTCKYNIKMVSQTQLHKQKESEATGYRLGKHCGGILNTQVMYLWPVHPAVQEKFCVAKDSAR